jgi:hypothetical protein
MMGNINDCGALIPFRHILKSDIVKTFSKAFSEYTKFFHPCQYPYQVFYRSSKNEKNKSPSGRGKLSINLTFPNKTLFSDCQSCEAPGIRQTNACPSIPGQLRTNQFHFAKFSTDDPAGQPTLRQAPLNLHFF